MGSNGEAYLIVELAAKGGMGAVYKALRLSDKTIWALKEMSESVIAPEDWENSKDAFYAEANLLQTLEHENLPKVIDVFEDRQRHYMVMDFIEGQTLTKLLAEAGGMMQEAEVVVLGKQLCLVLHYLHTHNPPIIYRDLKPDNVMVETATHHVKLVDFGIARRFKSGKKSDTVHLGTSGYAAPEQYGKEGRQSDAATDLYALGATLHQLLTGLDPAQNPFQFADTQIHAKVSTEVGAAISKAVKLRPEQRHTSAADMYEALTGESFPTPAKEALTPTPQHKPKPKPAIRSVPKTAVKKGATAVATPVLQTSLLQANAVTKGSSEVLSLPVSIKSGQLDVSTDAKWIIVSPDVADSSTREIEVTVDTSLLPLAFKKQSVTMQPDNLFSRIWWLLLWLTYAHAYYLVPHAATHQATVQVGQETANVHIEIVPSQNRIRLGWLLSSMAVATELIGAAWLVWLLWAGL
jgi:serine/threonine protein kinase